MTTEVPGYVTKTDLVAALIRELLITGELRPGRQLRQRDLAQRFGVSQTPVREAMWRLVAPDLGRVEENFRIRAALESLGASLAARKVDPAGLRRLRELNERMRALADGDAASARTYQHIMGADPVKELSGQGTQSDPGQLDQGETRCQRS